MEKLSADDYSLIDEMFKAVFRDIIIEKDPSFISRRYYGKRKLEAADHGEIHPETETD